MQIRYHNTQDHLVALRAGLIFIYGYNSTTRNSLLTTQN